MNISRNSDDDLKILKISVYRIAGAQAVVISRFGDRDIMHVLVCMPTRGMSTNHALVLDLLWTCPSSQNGGCQHVSDDFIKNAFVLP